jgi:hypothetical protein
VPAEPVDDVVGRRPVGPAVLGPEDEPATDEPAGDHERVREDESQSECPRDRGLETEERPVPRAVRPDVPLVGDDVAAEQRGHPLGRGAGAAEGSRDRLLDADDVARDSGGDRPDGDVEEARHADDERVGQGKQPPRDRAELETQQDPRDEAPPERGSGA